MIADHLVTTPLEGSQAGTNDTSIAVLLLLLIYYSHDNCCYYYSCYYFLHY